MSEYTSTSRFYRLLKSWNSIHFLIIKPWHHCKILLSAKKKKIHLDVSFQYRHDVSDDEWRIYDLSILFHSTPLQILLILSTKTRERQRDKIWQAPPRPPPLQPAPKQSHKRPRRCLYLFPKSCPQPCPPLCCWCQNLLIWPFYMPAHVRARVLAESHSSARTEPLVLFSLLPITTEVSFSPLISAVSHSGLLTDGDTDIRAPLPSPRLRLPTPPAPLPVPWSLV